MKPVPIFLFFIRVALGGVFIVSGFEKLLTSPQNFAAVIDKFEVLQGPVVTALSLTLPWAELIGGILLVLGLWTTAALAVLWLMNTVFIGVLASALIRHLPIDQCSCFGKNLTVSLPVMLSIDVVLWMLFFACFLLRKNLIISLDTFFLRHD